MRQLPFRGKSDGLCGLMPTAIADRTGKVLKCLVPTEQGHFKSSNQGQFGLKYAPIHLRVSSSHQMIPQALQLQKSAQL